MLPRIELTREELARLTEELREVYLRYVDLDETRDEPPEDATLISLQLYAFPVGTPDVSDSPEQE